MKVTILSLLPLIWDAILECKPGIIKVIIRILYLDYVFVNPITDIIVITEMFRV